jgi:hypothetical protein
MLSRSDSKDSVSGLETILLAYDVRLLTLC